MMGGKINEGMKKTTGVHEPQPRACLLSLHSQWERRIEGGKERIGLWLIREMRKIHLEKGERSKKVKNMFGKISENGKEKNYENEKCLKTIFEVQQANEGVDLRICKLKGAIIFQMI